ncbi:MAG: PD-(D/E)XK nuclease family protein [Betaproteobacteria bacterium]
MKPLAWSHSSLSGFMTCPRQYEEIKVLRNFQDQKNDASIWGDRVHTEFETYLKCAVRSPELAVEGLSPELHIYRPYLDGYLRRAAMAGGTLRVEQEYGLDVNLQPCAFLDPDVWCRGIVDVLTLAGTTAWVDDHKTGKNRKKDMQQLIIFALLTFYHHPEVNTCHTSFRWLQHDAAGSVCDSETFTRDQIPYLWGTLLPKLKLYKKAFDLGVFKPNPSGLCKRHCAVTTCEFHGGRR